MPRASTVATAILAIIVGSTLMLDAVAEPMAADAEVLFVGVGETPLTDAHGALLATVKAGAAAVVVPEQRVGGEEDTVEVFIRGWSWETGPWLVFHSPPMRITLATLTEEGQSAREVIGSADDAFGIAWLEVSVRGFVARADLQPDLRGVLRVGEELVATACGACHRVPTAESLPVYRWPDRLRTCRPRARLAPDELEFVTKYLQYGEDGR